MPSRASRIFKNVCEVEPICDTPTLRPRSSASERMPDCGFAMILNVK
jgi:hypothetical protein